MEMTRRGFLQTILAAGVAPAVVRAESIMAVAGFTIPTKQLILPPSSIIVPNGALAVGRTLTVAVDSLAYTEALADGLIEMHRQVSPRGAVQAVFALQARMTPDEYRADNDAVFRRIAKDFDHQRRRKLEIA